MFIYISSYISHLDQFFFHWVLIINKLFIFHKKRFINKKYYLGRKSLFTDSKNHYSNAYSYTNVLLLTLERFLLMV